MTEEAKPWEFYEVGEVIAEIEGYQVCHAVETSLHAPCIYHKVLTGEITNEQRESAISTLKRFAMLVHPRAPRLADAWFEEGFLVAIEYRANVTQLGINENNPLSGNTGITAPDFCERSLELLASLHSCGIVHGHIEAKTFGLGRQYRLYMTHTGIDQRLVECINVKELDISMLLSSNLFARDVGCWAFMVLSMMLQQPLCSEEIHEKWDDFAFQSARENLPSSVKRDPLNRFFMKALGGLGAWPEQFENAGDALIFWREHDLGGSIQ